VRALVFSADGRSLFTGGADGRIRAWACGSWKEAPLHFEGLQAPVHALALSGARLFSASRDGAVCVWNAVDGTREAKLEPGSGAALAMAGSGSTVVVSFAGVVLMWSSAPPFALKNTLRSVGVACGALALAADGALLFTGGADGRVAGWRTAQDERSGVQSGNTLGTHDAAVLSLALSPDGTRLFSACCNGELRSWAVRRDGLGVLQTANALMASWKAPGGGSIRALAAASVRAGAALAFAGGDDGAVRAWAAPPYTPSAGSETLGQAQDWILSLAVSHAGGDAEALLAAGGADGTCRVWRVGALLLRATMPPAALPVLAVGVPPPPMLPPPQAEEHVFPVPLREERAVARDALLREQDAQRARLAAFAREQQKAASPSKAQLFAAAPPTGGWRGGFGLDRHQAALARMYGPSATTHHALANAGMLPQYGALPGARQTHHGMAYGENEGTNLPGNWGGGIPPIPGALGAAWAPGTGAETWAYHGPQPHLHFGAAPPATTQPQPQLPGRMPASGQGSNTHGMFQFQ